jgi:hypothetical protein
MPGMYGCSGKCASFTPAAGEGFILRGGDTWANSDLGTVFTWAGSSGSPIYIGVDQSWYSGNAWARPVLSCGGSACAGGGGGNANFYNFLVVSKAYVTVDNIEFTGLLATGASSGAPQYLYMWAPSDIAINCYFHGWTVSSSATSDQGSLTTIGWYNSDYADALGDGLFYSVIDGSDSGAFNIAIGGSAHYIIGNVFSNVTNGQNGSASIVAQNICMNIPLSPVGAHQNCFQIASPAKDTTYGLIYDNVVTNVQSGGIAKYWWAQNSANSGTTWYVFDNIMYANTNGNNVNICQLGTDCGTHYLFNNTFECGSASGGVGVCANTAGMTPTATVTFANNHCMSSCENGASSSITLTETTDLSQTLAKADANSSPHYDQYMGSQTYVFSPVASTNSTVGAGTNEQSLCTTISGIFSPAGTACQNDTGYACSYNTTSHTVTCPLRSRVARPTSAAWDIGAYQFQSIALEPPTDVQAVGH